MSDDQKQWVSPVALAVPLAAALLAAAVVSGGAGPWIITTPDSSEHAVATRTDPVTRWAQNLTRAGRSLRQNARQTYSQHTLALTHHSYQDAIATECRFDRPVPPTATACSTLAVGPLHIDLPPPTA